MRPARSVSALYEQVPSARPRGTFSLSSGGKWPGNGLLKRLEPFDVNVKLQIGLTVYH